MVLREQQSLLEENYALWELEVRGGVSCSKISCGIFQQHSWLFSFLLDQDGNLLYSQTGKPLHWSIPFLRR